MTSLPPPAANGWGSFIHSVRFRLTLWFVLILALVLLVFSVFIYVDQTRNLEYDAAARIQQKLAPLQDDFGAAPAELSAEAVSGSDATLQKGDVLVLLNPNGSVVEYRGEKTAATAEWSKDLVPIGTQPRAAVIVERRIPVVGQNGQAVVDDYLFVLAPVTHDGHLLGYVGLGSESDVASQRRRLAVTLGLGSLVMLGIAFVGGWWLADRAMRPVAAITHAARNISESDLGCRLNLRGRDELADLGRTFDDMIGRLQAAFDRQRRFVADASHELRTPLTIMSLEIGRALEAQRRPDEYQHALEIVDAETARMTRLVNDLMTLARMDSGQAILQLADVDLSDVALEAVERMMPLAERSEVALETGELPELKIRGDHQYLLQMISNLIENGIKYSGKGKRVCVETSAAGGQAALRVSDTGPGIPAEHLPPLFDRFYRADVARTHGADNGDTPSGSGLGLSIVAWIVEAHHGSIHVASRVDEGTTFEVLLPLLAGAHVST